MMRPIYEPIFLGRAGKGMAAVLECYCLSSVLIKVLLKGVFGLSSVVWGVHI